MKNFNLFKETILLKGLTYEKACEYLKKAVESKAGKHYVFTICLRPNLSGWALCSRPLLIQKAFNDNPEDFIIQIDE